MSILSIKSQAAEGVVKEKLHAQVKSHEAKVTSGGKPFLAIGLVDATGEFVLRVWNDHSQFISLEKLSVGSGIEIIADFSLSDYGLELAKYWSYRVLTDGEMESLLRGAPEVIAKQAADWEKIVLLVDDMDQAQLRAVCRRFLTKFEEQFRRAAAARGNHHARRGGLVEHVSFMMQAASALCSAVYVDLHRDLVLAAILFHDCGKMWENQYEEQGFVMPFTVFAECYGHISIGVQLVHALWAEVVAARSAEEVGWEPAEARRDLRDLLCHLILSHHGELAFGSPVTPKCPEGALVHYVDQIDAKLEMMRAAYLENKVLAPGVIEAKWPIKGCLLVVPTSGKDEGGRVRAGLAVKDEEGGAGQ